MADNDRTLFVTFDSVEAKELFKKAGKKLGHTAAGYARFILQREAQRTCPSVEKQTFIEKLVDMGANPESAKAYADVHFGDKK